MKRFASLLTAVTLIAGCATAFPMSAVAEDTPAAATETAENSQKKLTLSKDTDKFDWNALFDEEISEIEVDEGNEHFTVADGVLYTKDMKTLLCCPPAGGIAEFTVPDGVERIEAMAFAACKDLKKVTVPDSVTSVGDAAFAECASLSEIKLPDTVTVLAPALFYHCSELKSFNIADTVTVVDGNTFEGAGCVEVEDGIHYVDNWAVNSDEDVQRGDIRMGTVGTATGVFLSRNQLKVITVPKSVVHLNKYLAVGLYMPLEAVFFDCSSIPANTLGCPYIKMVQINDPKCQIEDNEKTVPAYWREYFPPEETEPENFSVNSGSMASSTRKAVNSVLVDVPDNLTDEEATRYMNEYMKAHEGQSGEELSKGLTEYLKEKSEEKAKKSTEISKKVEDYFEKLENSKNTGGVTGSSSVTVIGDNIQTGTVQGNTFLNITPKVYFAAPPLSEREKFDTVIRGHKGSAAEFYAIKYGRKFEAIETDVYKGGDLNGDDKLSISDLILFNRYLHGTYSIDENQSKSADLNGDGKADVFDSVEFRRNILK